MRRLGPIHLAAGAACAVATIGAVSVWRRDATLVSDQALVEVRTRDVFSGDWPLVGPYSRFGWSHPGPAMFNLLAVPYRLFGGTGRSLLLACALLSALVVGVLVWTVARRSTQLGVAALLVVVVLIANGTASLSEPWNPAFAVLPMLSAMVAFWLAGDGDDTAFGVALLATLVTLQTHVGIGAALVPAMIVVSVVWWRNRPRRRPPIWLLVAVTVSLVPPALDTLVNWPGNAYRIVRFAGSDATPRVGLGRALELIVSASSPEFLVRPQYEQFFGIVVPDQALGAVPGALLVLLMAVSLAPFVDPRCRLAAAIHLCVAAASVIAMASIRGDVFAYMLLFLPVYATVGWAIVVVAAVGAIAESRLVYGASGLVAVAVIVVALIVASDPYVEPTPSAAYLSRHVADQIARNVASDEAFIVTTQTDDALLGIALFGGVFDELDRRGYSVRSLASDAHYVGGSRTAEASTTPLITITTAAVSASDAELLATVDRLDDNQRRRVIELQSSLAAELEAADLSEWIASLENENAASVPVDRLSDPARSRRQLEELSELLESGPQLNIFLSRPVVDDVIEHQREGARGGGQVVDHVVIE